MKKNILVGVSGGIAAYKATNIVSMLKKQGHNVKVIMTRNATNIIPPLSLQTLSRNKVYVDMWELESNIDVEHISLAEWADIVLIAPTTYNVIGKVANGIADDMLTTVVSAVDITVTPVYFALAMNVNMYNNPILARNIDRLKEYGYNFIESDAGFLACNVNAVGRLKKEDDIVRIINAALDTSGDASRHTSGDSSNGSSDDTNIDKPLVNKKIIITAGATREAIDPVRFLSNRSTGKMGYSLAEVARDMGADVTLISAPTNLQKPSGVTVVDVVTADEMHKEAMKLYSSTDIAIACAAVADYKVKEYSTKKIKKSNGELTLTLDRNPDILHEMGIKKEKQFLVGFAAETNDLIENATGKLKRKNLDMIVGNSVEYMSKDKNKVIFIFDSADEKNIEQDSSIITVKGSAEKNYQVAYKEISEKPKEEIAREILTAVASKMNTKGGDYEITGNKI